jgi:trans-2,3-dihydro-3-hydroxyanthranilate isomerase
VTQRSAAGDTPIAFTPGGAAFERKGEVASDLIETRTDSTAWLAKALTLDPSQIGLDARELGRAGRLLPAVADAGIPVLLVPIKDPNSLRGIVMRPDILTEVAPFGAYCFTAMGAGRIEARGLFPGAGIPEDPATGAAGAALGIYLADRIGQIEATIEQGLQIDRPSVIHIEASPGRVYVAGDCHFIFSGKLEALPR